MQKYILRKWLYSDIFSELNLSQAKGVSLILLLITKGYIRNVYAISIMNVTES
jgi:hypothetical protein